MKKINKIAINKIAINKIAINKIAINKIAINKIANYFIWFANYNNELITHLKLQKLCYFADFFYFEDTGEHLIEEGFKNTKTGPISESLWNRLKKYSFKPINEEIPQKDKKNKDPFNQEYEKPDVCEKVEEYLLKTIRTFWNTSSWELECFAIKCFKKKEFLESKLQKSKREV